MATIYSLICFGGKGTTKTATMTIASPCVVTVNNHGLRAGTGVVFTTTGALPTGVTAGTVYYANSTGANTFNLYDTSANAITGGATGRVNTSGTQSGTHSIKSKYYNDLTAGQKARYTYGGTEYIFDSLNAWEVHRSSTVPASSLDTEVCEIGMGWSDYNAAIMTINVPAAAVLITSSVDGVRTNAYHNGIYPPATPTLDSGYILLGAVGIGGGISVSSPNLTMDGWMINPTSGGTYALTANALNGTYKNMILFSGSTYGMLWTSNAVGSKMERCIVKGFTTGIRTAGFTSHSVSNCLVTGCTTGFGTDGSNVRGNYYNNESIGNTTNWGAATINTDPLLAQASHNAGLSGEAWLTGSNPRFTIATTDFANYAGNDFRPASVTSPQVEVGVAYYNIPTTDIGDDVSPAYPGNAINTVVTAGAFVTGLSYTIASVGSTSFTAIGASADTVGVTFKATGAGTGTGTATLNAKVDLGPYEFDLGYGGYPNSQYTTLSGYISGSRIKIAKQSDSTEIYNTTSPSWPLTTNYDLGTDTAVYIYVRKGSAAPFYKPVRLSATIDDVTGLTYDMTGLQIEDIAAATYSAGVASDWTFNSTTGAITHASGTTRYSVQDLYSWHQDYYDDSATVDDNPLINGITPTQFELINSGTITDSDMEDLFGGSVEFPNGTLWSNLYTAGSLAASHALYVVQNGSKVTSFWANGHIDILVKVSNAGVEVDNGQVTVYARPYGYSYAHYLVDMSAGGRNVAPISTLADPTTTAISSATAATYSDITVSFGATSHDLGEGGGAGSYRCDIDCAGRTLDQVYAYLMYLTRDASTATLNGESGWKYQKANSAYTANAAAPFGTYAGGFFTVAQGVWLTNYAASETYNFVLTDHAGVTHQLIEPTNQSVTISGATAGSRIQIYDTTSSTELYNGTPVFPYTWSDGSAAVADRAIRLRVSYVSGTSAKNFIEASIGTCGQTAETKDVSYLVSQSNDTTYNSNGINGPSIYATSGITFTDAATDLVNCNIAGGSVTYPTIYACFVYWNFTSTGIANDFTYISAPDTANYLLSGMKIRNTSATDLVVTGGYGRDATSGLSSDIIDTAGSTGNIFLAPDHVVPYATGSGVTSQDKIDIAAQVLTAAASAPIYAEVKKVATYTIGGDGTALNPWGPV